MPIVRVSYRKDFNDQPLSNRHAGSNAGYA
jgi:hypothetical protein